MKSLNFHSHLRPTAHVYWTGLAGSGRPALHPVRIIRTHSKHFIQFHLFHCIFPRFGLTNIRMHLCICSLTRCSSILRLLYTMPSWAQHEGFATHTYTHSICMETTYCDLFVCRTVCSEIYHFFD